MSNSEKPDEPDQPGQRGKTRTWWHPLLVSVVTSPPCWATRICFSASNFGYLADSDADLPLDRLVVASSLDELEIAAVDGTSPFQARRLSELADRSRQSPPIVQRPAASTGQNPTPQIASKAPPLAAKAATSAHCPVPTAYCLLTSEL